MKRPIYELSLCNILPNLTNYFALTIGSQTSFLWFNERLMSPLTAVLAMGGVILGTLMTKWRALTLAMLGLLVSTLFAMSFFSKVDGRYLIALFPAVIVLVGICLHPVLSFVERASTRLSSRLSRSYRGPSATGMDRARNALAYARQAGGSLRVIRPTIMALTALSITLAYFMYPGFGYVQGEPIAISLKKQVGLNFIHKADPWNYHAVQNLNSYFDKKIDKKPYVGTVLPPFYVAFYAKGNYQYLPITLSQEFISLDNTYQKKVMKTKTMVEYYEKLLNAGNEVYVTNIYLGNVRGWGDEFSNLSTYFTLKLVKEGCLGSCNIYRVEER